MKTLLILSVLIVAACGVPSEAPETTAPETATPSPPPAATANPPSRAAACTPAADRLCPVDEAEKDASFVAFRAELAAAVERRDQQAVLRVVDPTIRTTFGDGGGAQDFRARWKLDAEDGPLWDELGTILSLGGAFQGEGEAASFWAPYVFAAWPEEKDAFSHVAAVRAGVPIRARGAGDAEVVASVDWAVLELVMGDGWRPDAPWLEVRLPDGRTGWVEATQVRNPVGWRAGFMKKNGEWKLTALIAGD